MQPPKKPILPEDEQAYEAWFLAAVQQGLDDADAGRVVPHEEVRERLLQRIGALPDEPS